MSSGDGPSRPWHILARRSSRCGAGACRLQREPRDHQDYSDYRPDLSVAGVGRGGALLAGDLKLFDSLGSDAGDVGLRGGVVAFGNTQPRARRKTVGLRERGHPSDGAFKSRTGKGHVEAVHGDYRRALESGVDVRTLLFETLGGFSPEVVELLADLSAQRQNRLNKGEYAATTWSARSWLTFQVQKLSVALHHAVALEVAHALGLATAVDPR